MKQLLKRCIGNMPGTLPILAEDAFRYLRYPKIRQERRTQRRIFGKLERPRQVAQGPFQGMMYIPRLLQHGAAEGPGDL